LALAEAAQATELGAVGAERTLLTTSDGLGLLGLLLLLVLVLGKHSLLLVLEVGMVLPRGSLGVFGSEDDKDSGGNLVMDNRLVVFADNVDAKLDNVLGLEFAGVRLDRLCRETVSVDECTV
jgi:hypothetical protein